MGGTRQRRRDSLGERDPSDPAGIEERALTRLRSLLRTEPEDAVMSGRGLELAVQHLLTAVGAALQRLNVDGTGRTPLVLATVHRENDEEALLFKACSSRERNACRVSVSRADVVPSDGAVGGDPRLGLSGIVLLSGRVCATPGPLACPEYVPAKAPMWRDREERIDAGSSVAIPIFDLEPRSLPSSANRPIHELVPESCHEERGCLCPYARICDGRTGLRAHVDDRSRGLLGVLNIVFEARVLHAKAPDEARRFVRKLCTNLDVHLGLASALLHGWGVKRSVRKATRANVPAPDTPVRESRTKAPVALSWPTDGWIL